MIRDQLEVLDHHRELAMSIYMLGELRFRLQDVHLGLASKTILLMLHKNWMPVIRTLVIS